MSEKKIITFEEAKKLNGKELDCLKPYEDPDERKKGILTINGTTVFGCFKNEVTCNSDTFAFIYFYNKDNEPVANVSLFNVNNECFVIEPGDSIYSETTMRVMSYNAKEKYA